MEIGEKKVQGDGGGGGKQAVQCAVDRERFSRVLGDSVPAWLRLGEGEKVVQRKVGGEEKEENKRLNDTGLPDHLKEGVEGLSGMSLDDVHVHYNSSRPADVQALAYTKGTEIHVGPGQEQHLGHEAWHVVQQKQGRVKPTIQAKGVEINDDEELEREADEMGSRAFHISHTDPVSVSPIRQTTSLLAQRISTEGKAQASNTIQMLTKKELPEEEYGLGFSEEALKLRQKDTSITSGQNVATFHFIPRPPLQGQAAIDHPDFHKTTASTGVGVYDIHTHTSRASGKQIEIYEATNLSHSEHQLITEDLRDLMKQEQFPQKFVIDWVYTERPACPDVWSSWGTVIHKGCSTELENVEKLQKWSTPDDGKYNVRSGLDIDVYSTFTSKASQEIALAALLAPIRVQIYNQLTQDLYKQVTHGRDFDNQSLVRTSVEETAAEALPGWKNLNLSGSYENQKRQYETILKYKAKQKMMKEEQLETQDMND